MSVEELDRDRYGRTVGRATIGGKLVNAEMVWAVRAWRYTTYDRRNEFGGLSTLPAGNAANCGPMPTPLPRGSGGRRRSAERRQGGPLGWGGSGGQSSNSSL